MPRKSKKPVKRNRLEVVGQVGQILPMIAGIAATKADLTEWVYEQGLTALHLLLKEDAEEIAAQGQAREGANCWGSTNGERASVVVESKCRDLEFVRSRARRRRFTSSLPREDPLPERVFLGGGIDPKLRIESGQTRGQVEVSWHEQECRQPSPREPDDAEARGIPVRRLESFELAALMMDGLEVAGQTVVVTLGITIDGTKVPLGIWLGSTENSRVCTAMLQDLLERGLRVDEVDSLCSGRGNYPQGARRRFGGSRGHPKVPDP